MKDYIESGEMLKISFNPTYIEYFLNLFFQGYYGEFWEEKTKIQWITEEYIGDAIYNQLANIINLEGFELDEQQEI